MSVDKPKLTLLWHSVVPWVRSGYGHVTNMILSRLVKYGYRCIMSAYYGIEPGGIINYNGITTVPSKEGPFGIFSAQKHAQRFNTDIQFLFTDWWAFSKFPEIMKFPCAYSPMDHIGYPEEIINFTKKYRVLVSLCKFQQEELKKRWGIDSYMVYHGVETNKFKPLDKLQCKRRINCEDKFVFGTVAANSDKEDRKSHAPSMKAMRHFLDQNPDIEKDVVWIYHSNPRDPRGMPLSNICHKFKLDNIIKFMDPNMSTLMLSTEDLVILMNAFDAHILNSKREGYGLPIMETQSCGVPNMCHNFSSMPELVKGHGWLVKSLGTGLNLTTTPINAETATPDVYDIADKLERVFFRDKEREKYAKASREFALKFDWDKIVTEGWIPVLEDIQEMIRPKSLEERRLL